MDLIGGTDITRGISQVHKQGSATITSTGEQVQVNVNLKAKNYGFSETRARLQAEFGYKKIGIYLGYSWGFYKGKLVTYGGKPLYSFSRYFRAGISYRLK